MAVSEKLRKTLEKRKKAIAEKGQGFGYITFKPGKKCVRFLPPGDDEDFAIEVETFFLGEGIGSFVSPASFGLPCAAMDMYTELKKSKEEDDNKIAATFKPKKIYLSPVLESTDEKGKTWNPDETLAKLTGGMYSELIDWMLDEDYGDFTDEKNGYIVKINRTGSGQFDTEYKLMKLSEMKLPKKLKGKTFNPEEMVKKILPTYEDTQEKINKFLGIEEDDEPKKKKKKGSKEKEKSSSKDKKKKKKNRDL